MPLRDTFLGSFHSAALYRQVRTGSSWRMGYAFGVVLITTLCVCLYYGALIHRVVFSAAEGKPPLFDDLVRQVASQVPVMTLKDGHLQSSVPEPVVIQVSLGDKMKHLGKTFPLITIDTSGNTTHATMTTPMLITADDFIYKSDRETKIESLAELTKDLPSTLVINRTLAQVAGEKLIAWVHEHLLMFYLLFGGLSWVLITIGTYILRTCMLMMLGGIGLLLANILNQKLNYQASVALAAVSYTPVAMLDGLLMILGADYVPQPVTLLLAGAACLLMALRVSAPSAERIG